MGNKNGVLHRQCGNRSEIMEWNKWNNNKGEGGLPSMGPCESSKPQVVIILLLKRQRLIVWKSLTS